MRPRARRSASGTQEGQFRRGLAQAPAPVSPSLSTCPSCGARALRASCLIRRGTSRRRALFQRRRPREGVRTDSVVTQLRGVVVSALRSTATPRYRRPPLAGLVKLEDEKGGGPT